MVCSRRRQLLADYLERVQALAVEMELVLRLSDNPQAEAGWLRVEESRIQADIARLALETHTTNHRC
jgi:hypothetical protein